LQLSFEAERVFLDDGVDENLSGYAVDFGPGGGFGCVGIGICCWRFEVEEEILTLANIGDAAVVHPAESVSYRLALGIENSAFQRNINMGFH